MTIREPDGTSNTSRWCECDDSPVVVTRALTMLDHDEDCGFPEKRCANDRHRMAVHDACGKLILMRYCACGSSGFTHEPARDWWVHYVCGWPTRAWYTTSGKHAPEPLRGIKPVTYHEYVPVTGKRLLARLSPDGQKRNRASAGTWVWD